MAGAPRPLSTPGAAAPAPGRPAPPTAPGRRPPGSSAPGAGRSRFAGGGDKGGGTWNIHTRTALSQDHGSIVFPTCDIQTFAGFGFLDIGALSLRAIIARIIRLGQHITQLAASRHLDI